MPPVNQRISSLLGIVVLIIAAIGAYRFNMPVSDAAAVPAEVQPDRLSALPGFVMTTEDGLIMVRGHLQKTVLAGASTQCCYQLGGFMLNSTTDLEPLIGQAIVVLGTPSADQPEDRPYQLDVKHIETDRALKLIRPD